MSSTWISNAVPLPQLAVVYSGISASYSNIGQFTAPVEIMIFVSTLDAAVTISFDGINDHITIPAGSTNTVIYELNLKANRMHLPNPSCLVKQVTALSSGNLYINAFSATIP